MMKLSIVSNLHESRYSMIKITENFEKLCGYLANLGYDGIELSLLEPEKIDAKRIWEVLESYDLEISALGTGSTYIRCGYSLGHYKEEIKKKAIERIKNYIEFATEVDSKVIIGLIRGRYSYKSSLKKAKLNLISSLKICSELAEEHNVQLLFEPINRFEIDSYNTIAESVELLNKINSSHLKLLIDTFHLYLEEDPDIIWEDLEEIVPLTSHIHIADTTRRAPGTGHFDFKTFLNIFRKKRYENFISLETIMKPSFEEVAQNSTEYLKFLL